MVVVAAIVAVALGAKHPKIWRLLVLVVHVVASLQWSARVVFSELNRRFKPLTDFRERLPDESTQDRQAKQTPGRVPSGGGRASVPKPDDKPDAEELQVFNGGQKGVELRKVEKASGQYLNPEAGLQVMPLTREQTTQHRDQRCAKQVGAERSWHWMEAGKWVERTTCCMCGESPDSYDGMCPIKYCSHQYCDRCRDPPRKQDVP
ncbi:MAG: hypothetical protein Q9210_004687 [Variospora velana]